MASRLPVELRPQCTQGRPAMADRVLLGERKLGHRAAGGRNRKEERVVDEPAGAARLETDRALAGAFGDRLMPILANEHDHTAKARRPVPGGDLLDAIQAMIFLLPQEGQPADGKI